MRRGKILAEKYEFKDINRLKIGATLPDAAAPGRDTQDSHLKLLICGLTKKTYDFTRYRREFGRKMGEDDLYPFGFESFYEELQRDYEPCGEGAPFFFTEKLADRMKKGASVGNKNFRRYPYAGQQRI